MTSATAARSPSNGRTAGWIVFTAPAKPRLYVVTKDIEYTSGCVLTTPVGTMKGSYRMQTEDGVDFNATIPEFTLAMPRTLH